jgi:vitamin K-dependent gamma-carboxylase
VAALVAFRVAFGLLITVSALRFLAYGWVDELFVRQEVRFHYWGFGWVPSMPVEWMKPAFGALVVLGLMVSAGFLYRFAVAALLVFFAWLQLVDVTNYLNHYYLVTLLAALLLVMPLGRAASVDAWLWPRRRLQTFPAWCTRLLQFQVGAVYFFAGLAKLNSDWLLHAQPLNIWLPPHEGLPLFGWLLDEVWVHYAFSWFAFLFDVAIIGFMLWRRARPYAFAVIVVFHVLTHVFFNIGMFPFIMVLSVLVFFEPDWPRKIAAVLPSPSAGGAGGAGVRAAPHPGDWTPASAAFALVIAGFCLFQFLFPLRHWLYPGSVLWHEQGMRFSWRVMLREKSGSLAYRVVDVQGRTQVVSPYDYLTELQYREMAGQPDLILQLAHRIRDDFDARGLGPVAVYADSWVSLNGRPARRMIDPQADLARIEDGLAHADWITPAPDDLPHTHPPLRLARRE